MEEFVVLLNFVEARMLDRIIIRCHKDKVPRAYQVISEDFEYVNLLKRQCELSLPGKQKL
jgi:hypothetical protein